MRRALSATIVAATIAWSIGLSSLVAPLTARAAVTGGSLVKASLPAVYYVGSDMKRYVFPNEKTFKTWYPDFSGVVTITDVELASLPIGGNVTYKPGTRMVKITSDPKTYVVDAHGVLRWVKTEAAAVSLYGANWNQMIDDVSDAFFTNYSVGADVASSSDFNPSAVTAAATTIGADKSLADPSAPISSTLTVAVDPTQAKPYVYTGRSGATAVKFMVTNSGTTPQTITSLVLHRAGAGLLSGLTTLTLYKNGIQRMASSVSINSSTHDAQMNSLSIPVAAGETAKFTVIIGFASNPSAGDQHTFTLTDLRAGASIVSGLPIVGPTMTASGTNGGLVTVTKSGSAPLQNVRAGQKQQKIGEFKATIGSTEDVRTIKFAVTKGGTLDRSKLSNITIKQAGVELGKAAAYDQYDRATVYVPAGIVTERGGSKIFEVYADVAADARGGETIFTYYDAIGDMTSIGLTYGYGVAHLMATSQGGSYDGSSCALGSGNCSSVEVEGGRFTTTFNGPAAKDIASNAKDVELFNFTIAAQSNLEVRRTELQLTADTAANCALIDDLKIIDTASGAVIAGPLDVSNGSLVGGTATICDTTTVADVIAFTETWNMSSGQTRTFKVTADIDSTFPAAGTIKVALGDGGDIFDTDAVRNLDNNTFLTTTNNDFVPSINVTGNTHTVRTPSLTVTTSSSPVSQTYIQGTSNAPLLGVSLKAGDAGEVRVTTLVLDGYVNEDATGVFVAGTEGSASIVNIVQTAKLMNGATQVGDTKSPTSAGVVTFDNLNLTIAAGQTLNLVMTGTLAGSIASVTTADVIKFEVADDADVTATDKDGNSLSNILGPDGDGINNSTGLTANEGIRMTIASAGTVTVALAPDDTESEAGLVVGGATNAVLAKYRFNATNEELKLAKARMKVSAPTAVSSISLFDGATLVGGPASVDGSGNADFSNMNFVIPKDGSKVLTVKGNLNSVGSSGATTGSLATVTLEGDDVSTFEVRGTSAGSSTLITDATAGIVDVAGRAKVLRRTKPTIALVALPSSTLTAGEQVMQRFTVSADAAGDVAIGGLSFTITNGTASVVTIGGAASSTSSSTIRRVGDSSDLAGDAFMIDDVGGTEAAATCTAGTCYLDVRFDNEEVIAAGTSRTYDLRLSLTAAAANDSVSVKLNGDGTTVLTGAITDRTAIADGAVAEAFKVNATAAAFVWSDISASPHTLVLTSAGDPSAVTSSSADWANGAYVKVLPTDAQTMTK